MARAPQHLPESSAVDLAYEALEGIVGSRQMWPPWLGFSTSRISCDANKVSVDYGLMQPNVRAAPQDDIRLLRATNPSVCESTSPGRSTSGFPCFGGR